MAEYYNFDNDANVSIDVVEKNIEDSQEAPKAYNEEEVFEKKPKPKRVLTDAQKDALQRGRAKAKATRDAKKMEQMKKEILKEQSGAKKTSIKVEREQIVKAEKEATEQLKAKRQKKTAQEKARERIKMRKAEKDKVDNKKIDEFNELKYTCLGNCDDEEQFDKLDSILSKYITKADILKGDEHLRNKVGQVVSLLKK